MLISRRVPRLQHTIRRCLLLLFVAGSAACSPAVKHDPELAARRAAEFVDVAFVRRDAETAYRLLSDKTKAYVPAGKFKEMLARLDPGNRAARTRAIEYEPMPGERAIYVYVSVDAGADELRYTVTLEGTAATDYRVSKITRGAASFLPSTQERKRFKEPIRPS